MRYRLLGTAACVSAMLLPTTAPAQRCDEIVTERTERTDAPPLTVWISERILAGTVDPSCGGEETLGLRLWEEQRERIAAGCMPVKAAREEPTSRPGVSEQDLAWMRPSDFVNAVVVGEVTATEPGLFVYDDPADIYTRVRIRVTEVLSTDIEGVEIGSTLSFLEGGGILTTSHGRSFCSLVPPWAQSRKSGDRLLVAGKLGETSDPSLLTISGFVLEVVGDRAFLPKNWMPNVPALDLGQARAYVAGFER